MIVESRFIVRTFERSMYVISNFYRVIKFTLSSLLFDITRHDASKIKNPYIINP